MAEVISGELVVVVLDPSEAEALRSELRAAFDSADTGVVEALDDLQQLIAALAFK